MLKCLVSIRIKNRLKIVNCESQHGRGRRGGGFGQVVQKPIFLKTFHDLSNFFLPITDHEVSHHYFMGAMIFHHILLYLVSDFGKGPRYGFKIRAQPEPVSLLEIIFYHAP